MRFPTLGTKMFSNSTFHLRIPYGLFQTQKFTMNMHRQEKADKMPREFLRSRSRSRSPRRSSQSHHERHRSSRDRSRSPLRYNHHRSRHKRTNSTISTAPVKLPFSASSLSRHDLAKFRPIFALYLDIQKNLLIEDLTVDEVKGRWKSFIGKW